MLVPYAAQEDVLPVAFASVRFVLYGASASELSAVGDLETRALLLSLDAPRLKGYEQFIADVTTDASTCLTANQGGSR